MNDIAFTATVRADRMRWDDDPDARVTFHGTPGYRSVSDSDRVNLPYRVRAETTYRDVRVDYRALAALPDDPPDPAAGPGTEGDGLPR